MMSLSDLAKQLHMSRQALDARMKKMPGFKEKYTKIKKHRLYISKTGVGKLNYGRHDSLSGNFIHPKHIHRHTVTKQQLRDTIKRQQKLIAKLADTDNSQQKTIRQQSTDLNGHVKKIRELSSKLHHESESKLIGPKSTFWGRLKLAFHPKRK